MLALAPDHTATTFFTFFTSLFISLICTPLARIIAIKFDILDHPSSSIKTHTHPVPYLGGTAIFFGFVSAMFILRFVTSFPSGTLRSLRGILSGAAIVFVLGLIDDLKPHGLHYRTKFFFQILAACTVTFFGIRIKFINPAWLAYTMTIIWIVGITNAFNLIDIMDGLASGIAGVATFAFVFIALPTEELFVNLAAAALGGAALGFLPFNISKRWRIFMGDGGSLLRGFVCSALALGTSYGKNTEIGVFAPLMILCLPIYDTLFVFAMRILRGSSPFLGSKDHFALRLELLGWPRPWIIVFAASFSMVLCFGAFLVTRIPAFEALIIYAATAVLLAFFTHVLLKVKIK